MRILFVVLMLFTVAACGDDSKSDATPTAPDAGSADAGEEDAAPEAMCPNDYEMVCGGFCLDVRYDNSNCGGCGIVCPNSTMSCNEGACQCRDSDLTMCDGLCYDTDKTREHCGTCGNTCGSGDACIEGECVNISDVPEVIGVLEQTNIKRAETQDCGQHGTMFAVGPLQLNEQLNAAAQVHAEDMANNNFMAHEGSDGSSPGDRADLAGYPSGFVGENVARGYDTPASVVQGWTDSDGHCRNMMNGDYDELGVGFAVSNSGEEFWVQLFGRSN
jgi:hypothetical protein